VNTYVRARRFDLAEAALQEAGSAAGVESYGALINGYSRAKQFDFARGVMSQMASDGVPPNAIVYGDFMHRLVLDGRLREALLVTRDMKKAGAGLELAHYNSLLLGLGRAGHFSRALQLMQEMRQRGTPPVVSSYNILLNAAGLQNPAQVAEVISTMRKAGLSPDASTFTTLLKGHIQEGVQLERVRGLFREAESSGVRPDRIMLNAFVNAFARAEAFEEAEALVDRMAKSLATRPDRVTFATLASGYFRSGRPAEGLEVYGRAVESGAPLDAYFFNGIVEHLVRAGFYDDAVRVAGVAEKRGFFMDRNRFSELFELRSDEECSALERFKFWLGMPNQCYNEDWRARKQLSPGFADGRSMPDDRPEFAPSFFFSSMPPVPVFIN
jgi:pentatricopeptide repeat protein